MGAQAISFWQSVDGGALTAEEAEAKWKTMASQVGEEGVVSDQLGPPKKPLRLAVDRADMIYKYNKMTKTSELEFNDNP